MERILSLTKRSETVLVMRKWNLSKMENQKTLALSIFKILVARL